MTIHIFFSFPRESRKKEFDECSMYVVSLYCEIFNVEQQYAYVLQLVLQYALLDAICTSRIFPDLLRTIAHGQLFHHVQLSEKKVSSISI